MQEGDTTAATRAAAAEAHADHAAAAAAAPPVGAEAALAVCLQQPSFRGPNGRVAIALLAVSKRLAALVARYCGGALALHARMDKHPAALETWLSHHGALLAELDLKMDSDCEQNTVLGVLEQLHSSLSGLSLHGWQTPEFAAQQAAAFVRTLNKQQSMQLRSLDLPPSWDHQAATLLPALAALSQLTSLVMSVPDNGRGQLPVQHLPAQLQQLELFGSWDLVTAEMPWLALEHVTGLTKLSMRTVSVDGGVLPRGLRSLDVADVSAAAPLQPLQQLTALRLWNYDSLHNTTSAKQLRPLSMLRRLEQLSVYISDAYHAGSGDALAALGVLPLTHLSILDREMSAACLAHLGACTRLTSLELVPLCLAGDATLEQLAAAVARLTALEHVRLSTQSNGAVGSDASLDADWAAVCKALARLPRLTSCSLAVGGVGPDMAAQLAAATQLTALHVWGDDIEDGSLATICAGLRGLQRLSVGAALVTDECLSSIAGMPQLTFLELGFTDVTKHGVQQLSAARPALEILHTPRSR